MRTLFLAAAVMLTVASSAFAQAGTFEQITVSSTAIGISTTTTRGMAGCAVVIETDAVRMRFDGTVPTAAVGTPIPAAGAWVFNSITDAMLAKFIRETNDATAWISCWPASGPSIPIGAGGGGGGAGGAVTQGTDPWIVAPDTGTFAIDCTHDSAACSTGPQVMGAAAADGALPSAVTAGDAARIATNLQGVVYTRTIDPCSGAKSVYVVDIVTATTTEFINGAGASQNVYICGVFLGPTGGAQNLTMVEDDSDNCASPTAGMFGGVTAGEGWNVAANGGTNIGTGGFTVGKTTGTNRFLCLISSAAQQVSGTIVYVIAP